MVLISCEDSSVIGHRPGNEVAGEVFLDDPGLTWGEDVATTAPIPAVLIDDIQLLAVLGSPSEGLEVVGGVAEDVAAGAPDLVSLNQLG